MRLRLRWKIMLFTVLPIVSLAFAALWIVNRTTTHQVDHAMREDLDRAAAVLENVMSESERSLMVAGQVIVKDPRFFSALTLPGADFDPQVRSTIRGVALDFNALTQADLFEITDVRGRLLASVGRDSAASEGRARLVRDALAGGPLTRVLADPGGHHLVCVAPVTAGSRAVGALVLGTRIGGDLAERLRRLTRSEVTFVLGATITGTTLEHSDDQAALLHTLRVNGAQAGLSRVRGPEHDYLTLVRPLPHSEPGTRQLYAMQRAVDTETAFLRSIQSRLLDLGMFAVLVALAAGLLIAERITAPVKRLVRGAEEMERGNYAFPLEVRSHDEIGVLAASFDAMRRRQREYVSALKEATRIKSEFISIASHELRTPATIIRGFQEMMAQEALGPLTPQQRHAVDATLKGVDTLVRIAEDATRVSQIESHELGLHRDEHDVADLVDESIRVALGAAIGRNVQVAPAPGGAQGVAHVDRMRLVQALVNLITNGIRFTPDGGRVEIASRWEGDTLVLAVSDTGIGIAPERHSDLLSRPFALADARHHHSSSTLEFRSSGLGLGLLIARGIVEAHDGTLAIDSQPGRGTTVTLRLPQAAGAIQAEAA